MKKIKLLPSIIMLALCLCVLGIGVYSATTGSNTITGTLTVNSAGHEVDIAVYEYTGSTSGEGLNRIDHSLSTTIYGKLLGSATSRATSTISGLNLVFNSDEVNTFSEVEMIDLVIAVTNKSSSDIGVYFWDGDGTKPEQVTDAFVDAGHVVYGHQDMYADDDDSLTPTKIVDVEYSFYHHIPGYYALEGDSSDDAYAYGDYQDLTGNRYYTEYLHIYFTLEEAGFTSNSKTITFGIKLNVEEYRPNFDSDDVSSAYTYNENTFVKMDKSIGNTEVQFSYADMVIVDFYHNDTIKYVVVNYGNTSSMPVFNSTTDYADNCRNITAFSIPISVTSLSYGSTRSYTIESMIIPFSVVSIYFCEVDGLTSLRIPVSVTSLTSLMPAGPVLATIIFEGNLESAVDFRTYGGYGGYHWTFNGNTVTQIVAGTAGQGKYLRVAN